MQKETRNIIKHVGHVLDLWLPLKIKYDKIPGLSVGIVYEGELLYSQGFGYSEPNKKRKADEDTLYHIASISKTFTTVAIMQLVEEGKLRLDDKVSNFIEWFTAKDSKKDSRNITIRQLLSHTSGLFRDGDTPHWNTGRFPKDLKSSFSPGSLVLENLTGFKYTNYGFSVLGLVIEKVSGMSYAEYVEDHILKPLKMKDTSADYSDSLKNVATGYGREVPDEKRKVFKHYKTNAYAPATGFVSNVQDLAKFLSSLAFDSKDSPLDREAKKEMFRPHEKTEDDDEYGLGVDISKVKDHKIIGHSGGFNGFTTSAYIDPESGIGIVVLTNSILSGAVHISNGIFEMIFDALKEDSKHKGKMPSYKKYEGVYRGVWGDQVVAQFGKKLIALSPQSYAPLKFATTLMPKDKKKHEFIMKTKSVFASRDEIASFEKFRANKAQVFNAGPTPFKRVSIKN